MEFYVQEDIKGRPVRLIRFDPNELRCELWHHGNWVPSNLITDAWGLGGSADWTEIPEGLAERLRVRLGKGQTGDKQRD